MPPCRPSADRPMANKEAKQILFGWQTANMKAFSSLQFNFAFMSAVGLPSMKAFSSRLNTVGLENCSENVFFKSYRYFKKVYSLALNPIENKNLILGLIAKHVFCMGFSLFWVNFFNIYLGC